MIGLVAAQAQFGKQHQARALGVRAARELDDALRVARDVAHRHVDLREGDFDGRAS